jgi:hypothetical protein
MPVIASGANEHHKRLNATDSLYMPQRAAYSAKQIIAQQASTAAFRHAALPSGHWQQAVGQLLCLKEEPAAQCTGTDMTTHSHFQHPPLQSCTDTNPAPPLPQPTPALLNDCAEPLVLANMPCYDKLSCRSSCSLCSNSHVHVSIPPSTACHTQRSRMRSSQLQMLQSPCTQARMATMMRLPPQALHTVFACMHQRRRSTTMSLFQQTQAHSLQCQQKLPGMQQPCTAVHTGDCDNADN